MSNLQKLSSLIYGLIVVLLMIEWFIPTVFYGQGIIALFVYGVLMLMVCAVEYLKWKERRR